MSYAPDFSSASSLPNWVPPTAQPDYNFQGADAGFSPDAVFMPTAPLLQAPPQDVYTAPQAVVQSGNRKKPVSSDAYTPSFAKPTLAEEVDETDVPVPFMGKHPTQTALATGGGALAGGLLGGGSTYWFNKEDKSTLAPASTPATGEAGKTTTKTIPAKTTVNGWTFSGVHDDAKTPKALIDKTNQTYYEIGKDKAVTTFELGADGKSKGVAQTTVTKTPTTVQLDGVLFDTPDKKKTHLLVNKFTTGILPSEKTTLVTRKTSDIIEVLRTENNGEAMESTKKTYRALINQREKVAVELDTKGQILGIYKITDVVNANKFQNIINRDKLNTAQIDAILDSFSEATLTTDVKTKFKSKITSKSPLGKPNISAVAFDKLKPADQQLLKELTVFGTPQAISTPTVITDLTSLLSSSGFEPTKTMTETAAATKEAAEKVAGKMDFGKYALPVIGGAVVGAAALFGLDYFLQRRKPKATEETETV
jgi:hypothetical protein